MMSEPDDIPTQLAPLTEWLRHHFGRWNVGDKARADLDRVFDGISHRGNSRQPWFDVLWLKVQKLRVDGATLEHATHTALDTWANDDPDLPPAWQASAHRGRNEQHMHILVQQLKNRQEDVSDLGVIQVTGAHFWIALVANRHVVAARLYRAATPRLRKQLRNQLHEMVSRAAR